MSTRYIIDSAGRPVEAIVDLEELRTLLEFEELEEDREATEAFDADTELLESGDAELVPWEESKRRRRRLR